MNENHSTKTCAIFNYAITLTLILFMGVNLPAQEPLRYDISVDAMTIPLFVVDSAGNPVFNLKQEELQLVVNDNPMGIIYFNRYEFAYNQEIDSKISIENNEGKKELAFKTPDRIIFIIIDNVFNSSSGIKRSKKIAQDLIRNASQGDRFILLENTPGGGLKYMTGPSSDSKILMEEIAKIIPNNTLWDKLRDTSNDSLTNVTQWGNFKDSLTSPTPDSRNPIELEKSLTHPNTDRKKYSFLLGQDYENMMQRFSQVLTQFQYALKTITLPKIVFLISEGISNMAFQEKLEEDFGPMKRYKYKPYLFNYLKDIVKAFNTGGSVLYTINPQDISKSLSNDISGDMSLRFLAKESGGNILKGLILG